MTTTKEETGITTTDWQQVEALAVANLIDIDDIVYFWDPIAACWCAGEDTGTGVVKFAEACGTGQWAWVEP